MTRLLRHPTRFEDLRAVSTCRAILSVLFNDSSHFLQEDAGERIAEAFKTFRKEID
jgi:hypothetical protein